MATKPAVGYTADKASHLARLKRIEGQVRGIARMIEEDTYCIDVLTQVAATNKALQAVALNLLDEHIAHCVMGAAEGAARDEKLAEITQALARLVRV